MFILILDYLPLILNNSASTYRGYILEFLFTVVIIKNMNIHEYKKCSFFANLLNTYLYVLDHIIIL